MSLCRLLVTLLLVFVVRWPVLCEPSRSNDPKPIQTDQFGDALPEGAIPYPSNGWFSSVRHVVEPRALVSGPTT